MSANTPLEMQVTADGDELLITITGEVDAHSAPRLEGEIRAGLLSPTVQRLVVDLAAVTFIDSSGLRVLISTHRAMRERSGRFVIRQPSGTVRTLLDITHVAGEIDIEELPDAEPTVDPS